MNMIRLLRPRRISIRIFLLIVPIILAMSLLIIIQGPKEFRKQAFSDAEAKTTSISRMVAFSLAPALFFEDEQTIEGIILSARQNKDLAYLVVVDASGREVAAFQRAAAPALDFELLQKGRRSIDAHAYHLAVPLIYKEKEIGRLFLGLSLEEVLKQIGGIRRKLIIFGSAFSLVCIAAAFLLSLLITRPLRDVSETARQVALGDMTKRVGVRTLDEAGRLASSFNTMVDALKDARDTLEKRVEDRTRELQAEISERKRVEEALRKSEEDFRSMIENLGEGVAMISPDETFDFANVTADVIFGERPDGLVGKSLQEFLSFEQFAMVRSQTERRRTGERGHYEMEITRPDGARRILLMTAMPRFGARGEYGGALCVFTDITDRKTAETELRDANDKLRLNIGKLEQRALEMALLSEFNDSLQACNNEGELFAACGRYGQKLFPDQRGELYIFKESRNLLDVAACWGEVCPAANYIAPEDCWAVRRSKSHMVSDPVMEMLCRHVEAEGSVTPYLCIPLIARGLLNGLLHVRFPGPEAVAETLRKTQRDISISEHKARLAQNFTERIALALDNLRLRLELRKQSVRDPLTGLFNRRYMEETLAREVARSERNKGPLGIMMIDIDKFKTFNDAHGHEAGDTMLRVLARFLISGVRKEDVVCRFGGEEFIIILPGASLAIASERARTLLEEVKTVRAEFGGIELGPISLSLGVAVFPDHGATGGEVVQAADKALLAAKREGRARVVVAS